MSCYAAIDTNVLVSALLSTCDESATVQVLQRIFSGEIVPLVSKAILAEYDAVLRRPKFNFPEGLVDDLLDSLEELACYLDAAPSRIQMNDPKDAPFYDIVVSEQIVNAKLVTGNVRHFPKDLFVVTPRQMIDILDGKQ